MLIPASQPVIKNIAGVATGSNGAGSKIPGDKPPEAQLRTGLDGCVNVACLGTHMRKKVDFETILVAQMSKLPFGLVYGSQAKLIPKLVVPSLGAAGTDEIMNLILGNFGQRPGTHYTDFELPNISSVACSRYKAIIKK
jgi:hypothetical protein